VDVVASRAVASQVKGAKNGRIRPTTRLRITTAEQYVWHRMAWGALLGLACTGIVVVQAVVGRMDVETRFHTTRSSMALTYVCTCTAGAPS
jgi:hypothetical protein